MLTLRNFLAIGQDALQRKFCENIVDLAKILDNLRRPRYARAQTTHLRKNCEPMLSGIDLFRTAGDRMRYLTQRQTVISRNIANADTPGYKALDVRRFRDSPRRAPHAAGSSLALARTEPGHLSSATGPAARSAQRPVESTSTAKSPTVIPSPWRSRWSKSADVANAFALATAAYSKSISLMKIGIDSGR